MVSFLDSLHQRANGACELCAGKDDLAAYVVAPTDGSADTAVLACATCRAQLDGPSLDENHWRCLGSSMWSEHAPVQVLAYRILKRLGAHAWAGDLLGQLYLDDERQAYADAVSGEEADGDDDAVRIVDSNGTVLAEGDTVTLIKDLEVKGGGFTAKRGTVVKGINLTNDPKYVEGRVNGIRIVLVAAYLKKA